MKKSRLIWIIISGVIVYWGAAYPTLGNWIEALSVKLQPAAEVIDESTNRFRTHGLYTTIIPAVNPFSTDFQ